MITNFRPHHTEKGSQLTYWAEVTVKKLPMMNGEPRLIYRHPGCGWRWEDNNKKCPIKIEAMERDYYQ